MIGLLALAAAAAITPEAAGIPPEQAAGKALMACVKHSAGMLSISSDHRIALAEDGLAYESEPPPLLASMKHTPYGVGDLPVFRPAKGKSGPSDTIREHAWLW